MVSNTVVRTGVLVLLAVGMITMAAGPAVADCHQSAECDDDEEEEDPYYDGPNPDIVGGISDFIGGLVESGGAASPGGL